MSGLDPDQSFRELFHDFPGVKLLQVQMSRSVNRADRSVTVSIGGLLAGESAE